MKHTLATELSNTSFYKSPYGGTIMNASHFNEEVISFFRAETAFVCKILGTFKYTILLELGCANAMHYNTARVHWRGAYWE